MNQPLHSLLSRYSAVMVLDTETSGLNFRRDEIIEFSAVLLQEVGGQCTITREYDQLIRLSEGTRLDPKITDLTGICEHDLLTRGIDKQTLCADLAQMLSGNTLIVAYNAHFDLSFMYYLLQREQQAECLRGKDKLDLLTVYKDRRDYPHKLKDAIAAYGLQDRVVNSHRAIDDVKATVEVMKEMTQECDDLCCYLNLFGYNPKYGVQGARISSVRYLPQPFYHEKKLYE
jgi:DNA polymerase-3 subunit epsilon